MLFGLQIYKIIHKFAHYFKKISFVAAQIQHEGVVNAVEGTAVKVVFVRAEACAGCSASAMCFVNNKQQREVVAQMQEPLSVGDRVVLTETRSMGWKAVLLAYILPFIVMIGIVLILSKIINNEAIVGTAVLCSIGIYYIILSFFRTKLETQFSFKAYKKQ